VIRGPLPVRFEVQTPPTVVFRLFNLGHRTTDSANESNVPANLQSTPVNGEDRKNNINKNHHMSKSKIYTIDSADITLLKSNPPQLSITAHGRTTTGGWSQPELSAYIYIQPPPDGIYGFDFMAEPPSGIVTQALTPICASHLIQNPPPGLRGVRIHAVSGAVEALLGGNSSQQRKVVVRGTLTNEGVECQAMRTDAGELYTLAGNLQGFKNGDKVYVAGTIAEISICLQGITIVIDWISKDAPKAAV